MTTPNELAQAVHRLTIEINALEGLSASILTDDMRIIARFFLQRESSTQAKLKTTEEDLRVARAALETCAIMGDAYTMDRAHKALLTIQPGEKKGEG